MGHQDTYIIVCIYVSSELCLTSPWMLKMLSMFGTSSNISSSSVLDAKQILASPLLGSRQFLRCRKCLCKSRQGPVPACAGSGRARDGWMIGEDLACSTLFGPITGQDLLPLTNQRPGLLTTEFFCLDATIRAVSSWGQKIASLCIVQCGMEEKGSICWDILNSNTLFIFGIVCEIKLWPNSQYCKKKIRIFKSLIKTVQSAI